VKAAHQSASATPWLGAQRLLLPEHLLPPLSRRFIVVDRLVAGRLEFVSWSLAAGAAAGRECKAARSIQLLRKYIVEIQSFSGARTF
jgi:hypothetical protein